MRIKGLTDEDFVNYKLPSMFIALGTCDWKCCKEANLPIDTCQNCSLSRAQELDISTEEVFRRYISNPISEAVVVGGLEPLTRREDLCQLIETFRIKGCNDPIVIYTGYYPEEIKDFIEFVKRTSKNIIIKFGRYKPDEKPHYDDVIGVNLASNNQYGKVVC